MKAVRFYAKEDVRVEDVPAPNSLGDSQVLDQASDMRHLRHRPA